MTKLILSRWHGLLLIGTGLIVFGFLPLPSHWILLSDRAGGSDWIWTLIGIAQLSPIIPFGLALLITAGMQLPTLAAHILAGLCLGFGLLISAFSSRADAGFEIVFLQSMLLTIAVTGALLLTAREWLRPRARIFANVAVLLPAIAALGSLSAVVVVVASANRIADGRSFCLAYQNEVPARQRSDTPVPIESIWELRWFGFYTTMEFGFHGILMVETPEGPSYFRWWPWRLEFEPVENWNMLGISPQGSCAPSTNFWRSL